jgi:hypothetical protein
MQMDTLFCLLDQHNGGAKDLTLEALASCYPGQKGFGTLSMARNADFAQQLVGCLTHVIVSNITATDVGGLQTADGVTISSLMTSLNASLRQSLAELEIPAPGDSVQKNCDKAPQTDYQRLIRELQLQELAPIRIALNMPLLENANLSVTSAVVLLQAGVTAQDLVVKGYPQGIIDAFNANIVSQFSKI